MTIRTPDFTFNVGIPVFFPTEEELGKMSQLEPHMEALVTSGFMTKEEAYAYLVFSALSTGVPFMLNEFVSLYREHKEKPAE